MEKRVKPSMTPRQGLLSSERYRLDGVLGQGGMATVHRAIDSETGAAVALKRLRSEHEAPHKASLVELFEREYLTLCQLAHPRVVQVYDYGIDADGPYYTMELLDGGDLQTLAPLSWTKACAIARDVCSALSLLHSRRMIYRDLSPRNVRCTGDGSAKLIDFGAMAPMGPARELVGTAPCVAPEALNMQALDARTDLFALGATLYFALVRRHAYPARDLAQLRDVWRSRPRRVAEIVPEVPPALDQLVMELLQLDAAMRPASAAEVWERLSAISGAPPSEQALVAQAYLSSPSMIGRQRELSHIRKSTFSALQRKGGTLLITGAPGTGRSRLLDACVLEAKLAGLLVVRIHGHDSDDRVELGIARSIATSLLESARSLALGYAAEQSVTLAEVIPELRHADAMPVSAGAEANGALLQQALVAWLLAVAQHKPLLLAVDDLEALDDRSAGLLAVLAERTPRSGVLLAVTTSASELSSNMRAALRLLESRGDKLPLEPLSRDQVQELLASIFGGVPHLAGLASYLHDVADGNPRDTMQVAQQLVAEGLLHYAGGTWSLPDRVRLNVLPASLRAALGERARKMPAHARHVALAFALEPSLRFSFEECSAFAPELEQHELFRTLEDLVLHDVLMLAGMRYGLRQQAWVDALVDVADRSAQARAHAALAKVLEQRGDTFRASGHLLASGERGRGLDLLLRHVEVTTQSTDIDPNAFFALLRQLPSRWLSIFERALEACRELNRPARDAALLMSRLEGLISHAGSDVSAYQHIQVRLEQLSLQCGLDVFATLPAEMDVVERMKAAFQAAGEAFDALPAEQQVYAPTAAVKQLAQSVLSAIGVIAFTHDVEALRRLPPMAPLAALFPTMSVVRDLVEGVASRITGRPERALALYDVLLSGAIAATDAELSQSYRAATRLRLTMSAAAIEAAMGVSRSLERLAEVEQQSTHAAQAMLVRHLYFAFQGELREAERCKRQAEVLQVQSTSHHGFEGQHLFSELCAYALCDDLTLVRNSLDAIEARARTHAAWAPMLHYARGEFQRIRGDLAAARGELELALSLAGPGEQPLWAMLAGAHVRVIAQLGDYEAAVAHGEDYLRRAEQAELGYTRVYVAMPWSVALAHDGRCEEAMRIAEEAVATFEALGTTGLNLALAHETRARVALRAGDREAFEEAKARAAAAWPDSERRLGRVLAQAAGSHETPEDLSEELSTVTQFLADVVACDSAPSRAQCGLAFIQAQSRAQGALLYVCGPSGLTRAASVGVVEPSESLDARAAAYLDEQLAQDATTDAEDLGELSSVHTEGVPADSSTRPVLLMHQATRGLCITGVVVLIAEPLGMYRYPARLAGELSRCLVERGDALPIES